MHYLPLRSLLFAEIFLQWIQIMLHGIYQGFCEWYSKEKKSFKYEVWDRVSPQLLVISTDDNCYKSSRGAAAIHPSVTARNDWRRRPCDLNAHQDGHAIGRGQIKQVGVSFLLLYVPPPPARRVSACASDVWSTPCCIWISHASGLKLAGFIHC